MLHANVKGIWGGQSPLNIVMGKRENYESQTFKTMVCALLERYKYVSREGYISRMNRSVEVYSYECFDLCFGSVCLGRKALVGRVHQDVVLSYMHRRYCCVRRREDIVLNCRSINK